MTASLPRFVVDASVLAKCVIAEPLSSEAADLLELSVQGHLRLAVPEWAELEVAQVLARRFRQGSITRDEAGEGFALLREFGLEKHATGSHLPSAFELGLAHQQAIYDCLYLSLALQLGCPLITADRRFYAGVHKAFPMVRLLSPDLVL